MRTPPLPWAKWEDGEVLGWETSWALWRHWLFPYRTAELIGIRNDPPDMILGPWKWHPPEFWRQLRKRAGS